MVDSDNDLAPRFHVVCLVCASYVQYYMRNLRWMCAALSFYINPSRIHANVTYCVGFFALKFSLYVKLAFAQITRSPLFAEIVALYFITLPKSVQSTELVTMIVSENRHDYNRCVGINRCSDANCDYDSHTLLSIILYTCVNYLSIRAYTQSEFVFVDSPGPFSSAERPWYFRDDDDLPVAVVGAAAVTSAALVVRRPSLVVVTGENRLLDNNSRRLP